MQSFKISLILFAIAAIAFTGCKKDKEDPTIKVNKPAEHSEFNLGDEVHIEVIFADDRELASYTFMIGDEDGGHIHGFHHDDDGTLKGTEHEYHTMVTVPDSLAVTVFYLHFTVTDAEGKKASKKHMLHTH